ncbi:MAG: competence protein CoiA family protein [Solibacillus sp.]
MLVALAEDQSYVMLTHKLSRVALQRLREAQRFFCPQCKEPLLLKIGQVKIPHFAHRKNSQCDSLFTEGESQAHLLGKQQLFTLFQRLELEVKLEPYLKDLQQRPDLLVTKNNQQYAIEFQCSRLVKDRFIERTKGYKEHGITPVWILNTPSEKYKQQGLIKISINHYQYLFLKRTGRPFLMSYDVERQTFYYINHLIFFQGQQYFGFGQSIPLSQQAFPFYVPQRLAFDLFQTLFARYKQENTQYLHARLMFSRGGVQDDLLRAMYELRLSRDNLPPFIGVMIKGQESMTKPAVEWQILLFYYIFLYRFTFSGLTDDIVFYFLDWANLSTTKQAQQTVTRYVRLLVQLKIEGASSNIDEGLLIKHVYDELFAIE